MQSGRVEQRMPLYAGYFSIAAFAAIHVAGYVGAFPLVRLGLCFVQYLPAGVLLAWAMERTDSICTAICMHLVINAVSLIGIL